MTNTQKTDEVTPRKGSPRSTVLIVIASVAVLGALAIYATVKGAPKTPAASAQPAIPPAASAPVSNWEVSSSVSPMDGIITTSINTEGLVYLHLCYQNKGACSVPVARVVPNGCYVESNVYEDYSDWKRQVRVKFDDGSPQTETWSISDDRHAIIPSRSKAFISELKKHQFVMIEMGCDPSDTNDQELAIYGLQDAIASAHVEK